MTVNLLKPGYSTRNCQKHYTVHLNSDRKAIILKALPFWMGTLIHQGKDRPFINFIARICYESANEYLRLLEG